MPRRIVLALGALALAVAGLLVAGPLDAPRVASAAAPPAHEYKVLLIAFDDYKEKEDYKAIERREKDTFRAVLAFQEYALAHHGKEGWRLIHVEAKTPAQAIFYLERPLAP